MSALQCVRISSTVAAAGQQHHDGVDPLTPSGSGTPITADAATAGWLANAFSTSAEYTFSPPVTIMSLMRSTMNT